MTTLTLLWMALTAHLNRWRGTGNRWSLTIKRLSVSVVLCVPLAVTMGPMAAGLSCVALAILGFSLGWGEYFDMSDRPNKPEAGFIDRFLTGMDPLRHDLVGMSLRGALFTAPTAGILLALGAAPAVLILAPVGALMGPTYWLAKRLEAPGDHIALAELAWGAILGGVYFDFALLAA